MEIVISQAVPVPNPAAIAFLGASRGVRLRAPVETLRASSRFEASVIHANAIHEADTEALGILLAATARFGDAGRPDLRPIWAEEAMHRAYGILRLSVALRRWNGGAPSFARHLQHCLAREIAAHFASLDAPALGGAVACSAILRDLVRALVSLFGPGIGAVDLRTHIERVSLPACKRRALVLLAWELVMNALLHGLAGRNRGRIDVSLRLLAPDVAWLRVTDDGVGFAPQPTRRACGVAASLATLLDTELHDRSDGRSTVVSAYFLI